MSRPRATSPALTAEARHLARELSALRERTGLSLAALSDRTTASKSSWHRYLNGTKLPPAGLVRELCELAGEPPQRLLALWELAQAAASQGDTPSVAPTGPTAGRATPATSAASPPPGRSAWWAPWPVAVAVALVAAATVATGGWLLLRDGDTPNGPAATETSPVPTPDTVEPRCEGDGCDGLDPDRQACTLPGAGLATVAEGRLPDGTAMELRYSEKCGAGWGRIWASEIGDRLEASAPDREAREAEVRDAHDAAGYVYTAMVAAEPDELSACLIRADEPEPFCIAATA